MLVLNGNIITMAENMPVSITEKNNLGFVYVEGDKINRTGNMRELPKDLADRHRQEKQPVLDVHGAWVLPGLIDAHCHVGITEEKWGTVGDDCNEVTSPLTPHLRAIDAVNPMDPAFHDAIIAGITSLMTGGKF